MRRMHTVRNLTSSTESLHRILSLCDLSLLSSTQKTPRPFSHALPKNWPDNESGLTGPSSILDNAAVRPKKVVHLHIEQSTEYGPSLGPSRTVNTCNRNNSIRNPSVVCLCMWLYVHLCIVPGLVLETMTARHSPDHMRLITAAVRFVSCGCIINRLIVSTPIV